MNNWKTPANTGHYEVGGSNQIDLLFEKLTGRFDSSLVSDGDFRGLGKG